jgi:hypothetical protein
MNKLSHKRVVDKLIDAYVSWREACLRVTDAYGSWAGETGQVPRPHSGGIWRRSTRRSEPPTSTPDSFGVRDSSLEQGQSCRTNRRGGVASRLAMTPAGMSWSELTRSTVVRSGASLARRDPWCGPRDTRVPARDDPGAMHVRKRNLHATRRNHERNLE